MKCRVNNKTNQNQKHRSSSVDSYMNYKFVIAFEASFLDGG